MTGNELHQDCLPSSDSFSPGMCLGYIEGVGHPLVAAGALCNWSPEVTHTQTRDVVVSYLRDHPADRHADAYWLVTAALQSAWPYHQ